MTRLLSGVRGLALCSLSLFVILASSTGGQEQAQKEGKPAAGKKEPEPKQRRIRRGTNLLGSYDSRPRGWPDEPAKQRTSRRKSAARLVLQSQPKLKGWSRSKVPGQPRRLHHPQRPCLHPKRPVKNPALRPMCVSSSTMSIWPRSSTSLEVS